MKMTHVFYSDKIEHYRGPFHKSMYNESTAGADVSVEMPKLHSSFAALFSLFSLLQLPIASVVVQS